MKKIVKSLSQITKHLKSIGKTKIALFLIILFVLLSSIKINRVGELWDEQPVALYGEIYLGALKNLDFSESTWKLNHEHPPLGKYIYGIGQNINKRVPLLQNLDPLYHQNKKYSFSRFLSILISATTIFFVYLIASTMFEPIMGIVAILFLLVNPQFLAYTNTVSLEAPFLLFSTIFGFFLYQALKYDKTKFYLSSTVFLGLALATRFNAVFLFIFYLLALLLKFKVKILKKQNLIKIMYLAIPFAILFFIWPYLWSNPVKNFLLSIDRGFEKQQEEFFLGTLGIKGASGFFYYFLYFLVTTPLTLLVLFISRFIINKKVRFEHLFLILWFLVPFLSSFLPLKQDGIRYVQFMVVPFSLICASFFVEIGNTLKNKLFKIIFLCFVFASLLFTVHRFYPYYLDYYNLLSGGTKNINIKNSFELGWWGEGSLQAGRYIKENIPSGSTIYINFVPDHVLPDFENKYIRYGNLDKLPDYIISNIGGERYGDYRGGKLDKILENYTLEYEELLPQKVPLFRIYKTKN